MQSVPGVERAALAALCSAALGLGVPDTPCRQSHFIQTPRCIYRFPPVVFTASRCAQERFRRWSVAQTARAAEERAASEFLAAQRLPSADPLAQRLRSVALREDSESGSEAGADPGADAEGAALRCGGSRTC